MVSKENNNLYLNYSTLDIKYNIDNVFYNQLLGLTRCSVTSVVEKYKDFAYLGNKQLEISLVLTSNKAIKQINYEWRKINKPTNVLSMAMFSKEDINFELVLLGDIVISIETATSEAEESNISLQNHILRLLVHGMLHIFGFDHQSNEEALVMQDLENNILKQFSKGIPALTSNYWT